MLRFLHWKNNDGIIEIDKIKRAIAYNVKEQLNC